MCGVKTITWYTHSSRKTVTGQTLAQPKHFQPHETLIFVRLVKWALKALDIYTLNGPQPGAPSPKASNLGLSSSVIQTKTKEEKEVLEHFSGVFSMMNSQTFHEIFSTTIEYLVERVHKVRVNKKKNVNIFLIIAVYFSESHVANGSEYASGESRDQSNIRYRFGGVFAGANGRNGIQLGKEPSLSEIVQVGVRKRVAVSERERGHVAAAFTPNSQ